MYVIDSYCAFHLLKTEVKTLFLYQELLKIYRILGFPAAPDSWFYIWWCHQKNDDVREKFFIFFERILYGAYNYKVSWL